jgi:hypothetical protein
VVDSNQVQTQVDSMRATSSWPMIVILVDCH